MRRTALALVSALSAGVLAATIGVSAAAASHDVLGGAAIVAACPAAPTTTVDGIAVPAGPVAGYCQGQLVNAAAIIAAAKALGIGPHTQAVGVMTAIGESGLVNLNHGDTAGPDSRGLFQQRANGAWGSLADRTDPYTAATMFFDKLVTVPGWKTLSPTLAAHAVQANADPNHYTQYWARAKQVVHGLTGETVPNTAPS